MTENILISSATLVPVNARKKKIFNKPKPRAFAHTIGV